MRAVIIIATLLGSASFLQAQRTGWPNTRQGFWIGFGVGDGSVRTDCTYFCDSGRIDGFSGYIRLGGTLSPRLRLGGETNVLLRDDFGRDFVGAASFVVMWYPRPTGASYLKLGVGGLRYTFVGPTADHTDLSATAPSVMLGVGYEVRVRSGVSLVPWIDLLASSRVRLHYRLGFIDPPTSPPDVRINLVQAGLGVTWH